MNVIYKKIINEIGHHKSKSTRIWDRYHFYVKEYKWDSPLVSRNHHFAFMLNDKGERILLMLR